MTKAVFLLLLVPGFVFAQGQVLFANNGATAITNFQTMQRAVTSTSVGLYVNPNPNANAWPSSSPGWLLLATTNLTVPGIFLGGIVTLPSDYYTDRTVAFQVRAWLSSTPHESFEAALDDPNARLGWSVVMVITPRAPPAPPPALLGSGLQPFFIGITIPEPTTLALAGLGLASLALGKLARRRPPNRQA